MVSKKVIYLDNAATTPMLKEIVDAMTPYYIEKFGNPSSIYSLGRESKIALEQVRQLIAEELNCSKGEIIFTSGGTESINNIIKATIYDLNCTRIITSPIEHHATLHTLKHFNKTKNIKLDLVNIDHQGHIDYAHLEQLLKQDEQKTCVILLHANNEIGNITNAEKVSTLCEQYNAILCLDTVQTIAHYKFDLQKLKLDFLTCAAHKFHGPKGVGFMYVNAKNKINPVLYGGGQERNMRAGTENLPGIIGLGKAFELQYKNLDSNRTYILELKKYFYHKLKENIPTIKFFGDEDFDKTLYTVLNIGILKNDKTDLLIFNLDIQGICVSSGSACSSGSEVGSHVINAINKEYSNIYQTIRFSFSHLNTKAELDLVVEVLNKIV